MDHKVGIERNVYRAYTFGIALSSLGLFLPWGTEAWPDGVLSIATGYVFGFEVLVGSFALVGCLMAVVSWARSIRRREHSPRFVFVGEAVVAFFSLFWIVNSRNLPWVWRWYGGPSLSWFEPAYWSPTYGAYISSVGALIALTTLCLWPALRTAR